MNSIRLSRTFAIALVASLALAGCKKEEAAPPPVVTPAPAPAPAPMAATAMVTEVVLGNAADANGQVSNPVAEFASSDTITASVITATSDPMAAVPGTLSAKWSYEDGQVVNEESKSFNFTGPGVTNFQISKPDGWPAGGYTLVVMLDGVQVDSRTFTVR
ncbi:hypothetical protein [Arenimonas alkanexedens]